jgi:hypothetical protein
MIRLRLFLVAEAIVRDAETNRVSAFNIVENMTAAGFPTLIPRIAILTAFERDSVNDAQTLSGSLSIRLGGDTLLTGRLPIDFRDKLVARHIGRIEGLIGKGPGRLVFGVEFPEQEITATFEVSVDSMTQPTLLDAPDAPDVPVVEPGHQA